MDAHQCCDAWGFAAEAFLIAQKKNRLDVSRSLPPYRDLASRRVSRTPYSVLLTGKPKDHGCLGGLGNEGALLVPCRATVLLQNHSFDQERIFTR